MVAPSGSGRSHRPRADRSRWSPAYVEIPRSDHLVFFGEALPVTMRHIDDWVARNRVLASA